MYNRVREGKAEQGGVWMALWDKREVFGGWEGADDGGGAIGAEKKGLSDRSLRRWYGPCFQEERGSPAVSSSMR